MPLLVHHNHHLHPSTVRVMANPRYRNGHRRRRLRARHLATAHRHTCPYEHCPWPNEPFDRTLPTHHDKAPEVDEITPISLGGDPLSWANTRLLHRYCNRTRSNRPDPTPAAPPPTPRTSRPW